MRAKQRIATQGRGMEGRGREWIAKRWKGEQSRARARGPADTSAGHFYAPAAFVISLMKSFSSAFAISSSTSRGSIPETKCPAE